MDSENLRSRGNESVLVRCLSSGPKFLLLIGGYFVLQIALRLLASDTADIDEAEQLLATQQWQWGYGPQPPLYTWLLIPLTKIVPGELLANAILKNALMFGLYAITYATARMTLGDRLRSAVAALSLLFLPQIAWEAQRDLSHSVMVTFMAVTTFHVFVRLLHHRTEQPNRHTAHLYATLGLCLGAGVLSKYSFLVFASGLLIGATTLAAGRAVVFRPMMLLALAIAIAFVVPHFLWGREHLEWVLASSNKFKIAARGNWFGNVGTGLGNLAHSLLSHLGPLLAVYAIFSWRKPGSTSSPLPLPEAVRLITRSGIAMLALLIAAVLIRNITGFKDRWMMPLCVWMPILLGAVAVTRLDVRRLRWMAVLAVIVMMTIGIAIPGRVWFIKPLADAMNKPDKRQAINTSFTEFAPALNEEIPPGSLIVAADSFVGGNLRLRIPNSFAISPTILLEPPSRPASGWIVWNATQSTNLPKRLLTLASEFGEVQTNAIRYVEAPMKFWPGRKDRLGYAPVRMLD